MEKFSCDTNKSNFYCGVIEGFYGRPWSSNQRQRLFRLMQGMQLNTYMYAPKDDSKHRSDWRQLYNDKEATKLRKLIEAAHAADVIFIYALSPGLDMRYSQEGALLNAKLAQVRDLGCRGFALLFDDINPKLRRVDRAVFGSPAEAQCAVTNAAFEHLDRPLPFLFCPTEYCASRAKPCVSASSYLRTVGSNLAPQIGVFWTGPRVVSETITAASVREVASVLKRPPVIWDNLHANDYDPRRLYLGPYSGRDVATLPLLGGVLTNPNCEFEANYIAIHTLAQWSSYRQSNRSYDPNAALHCAVRDWLPYFNSSGCPNNTPENAPIALSDAATKPDSSDEDSDNDQGGEDNDSPSKAPLTADELLLVCHLFYLPFSHGESATRLMDEFHCLRVEQDSEADSWLLRVNAFKATVAGLRLVRSKLELLPCRRLVLELMPFVADACQALGLLSGYLVKLTEESHTQGLKESRGDHVQLQPLQPYSVGRGGVASEFQRLLPASAGQSLQLHRVFAVRRHSLQVDMGALSALAPCTEPALQLSDLPLRLRQSLDSTCAAFCLEDAFGVCAFACVLPVDSWTASGASHEFPLSFRSSPVLHLSVSPAERCEISLAEATSPLRQLLDRCLEAFDTESQGGEAVHCAVPSHAESPAAFYYVRSHRLANELCDHLGFHRVDWPQSTGGRAWQLLARSQMVIYEASK